MEEIHKIDIKKHKQHFNECLEHPYGRDLIDINNEFIKFIDLEEKINECLTSDTKTKINLGSYLKEIRDYKLYSYRTPTFSGYYSFEEYCEKEIGISKGYASRLININEYLKSCAGATFDYNLFTISQLQEMMYLTEEQLKQVDPTMTKLQIRQLRTAPKTIDELKQEHDKECDCHSCKTQDKYKLTIHDFNIENTSYDVDYFNNFNKQDLAVIAWNLYEELNYYRKQRKIQNVK